MLPPPKECHGHSWPCVVSLVKPCSRVLEHATRHVLRYWTTLSPARLTQPWHSCGNTALPTPLRQSDSQRREAVKFTTMHPPTTIPIAGEKVIQNSHMPKKTFLLKAPKVSQTERKNGTGYFDFDTLACAFLSIIREL